MPREPFHMATCGCEHAGRVCATPLVVLPSILYLVAMIVSRAASLSTQRSKS